MTSDPAADRPTLTSLTLASLPYLTLLGCAGIAANILLSFEEPHGDMLLVSFLLLAAAPVGMVLHLALTKELAPAEKRRWMAGLISRRGSELFGAYFTSTLRRRATEWLASQVRGAEVDQEAVEQADGADGGASRRPRR